MGDTNGESVRRRHRWLLAAAAIIVLLPFLAVLAVRLWLDPERFRQRVESSARQQLGLPVTLHDKLYWSWWPLFAIEAGGGAINDAAGQPLLRWRRLQMGAQWRGLLHDEVLIDSIRFDGLQALLRRDAAGRGNWEALFNRPRGSGSLRIARLQLTQGTVSFLDEATARSWTATSVSGELGLEVNQATATTTFTAPRLTATLAGTGLAAGGTPLSIDTAQAVLNTTASALTTAPLHLRYADLDVTVTLAAALRLAPLQGAGELRIDSQSLRRSLTALEVSVPTTRDADVLGPLAATVQWRITASAVDFSPLRLQLDATTVQGSLHWPLDGSGVPSCALRGDRLDADRYLPPSGKSRASAELPLAQLRALKLRGSLTLDSLTLRGVTARSARIQVEE